MDWLDELNQIREDAESRLEQLDLSVLGSKSDATKLLSQVDAHNLLRRVRSVLLKNKGTIDVFDNAKHYERAIALVWQGSIASPRTPQLEDDAPYFYIIIGAKRGQVYVDGRPLAHNTPDALKAALVAAAKKPGIQKQNKKK